MTTTEAAGLVTRIARYYPSWLKGMDENEIRAVMRAWAEELAPLGNAAEVWEHTLIFLRTKAGQWPPGLFEIRAYVKRRLEHEKSMIPKIAPPGPCDRETAENSERFAEIRKILGRKGKKA